jgi:hypothetical protein
LESIYSFIFSEEKMFNSNLWLKRRTQVILLAVTIILTLAIATPALAGETITDDTHAVLPEDQVVDDDLFISGQTVEVLGTVKGDLFAAGQQVVVRGVVEGNLFSAGQVVVLGGQVDGSAYAAGYAISLEPATSISRNLYAAGFSVYSEEDSQVARNFYGAGYQLRIDGYVDRDATISGSAVEVNGFIGGDAKVKVEMPPEGQPGENFTPMFMPPMTGGYTYTLPEVAKGLNVPEENVGGELIPTIIPYQPPAAPQPPSPEMVMLNSLRKIAGEGIALLIVGGLMLAYIFGWVGKVVAQVRSKPLPSLGWGALVYVLVIPVFLAVLFLLILAVLILSMVTLGALTSTAISIGGLGFGALVSGFSITAGLVAKVIIAYLFGHLLLNQTMPATLEGRWGKYWALLLGVVLYELLMLIPVGRIVVIIAVSLFGVGAIFSMYWERYQARKAAAA